MPASLSQALTRVVGTEWFRSSRRDLLAYSYDGTGEKRVPAAVVFPGTAEEVAACLRLAAQEGVPVVPRGAGTNLSGGSLPVAGALVLCLVRLDRILEIDPAARLLRAECGVTNEAIQKAALAHDLFFAPDPSSMRVATLGGCLAENAGGPRCTKYGVTLNHVLGAQVALADGTLLEVGAAVEDAPGLDLLSALIGSEGTLAVVVSATVRLTSVPKARRTMVAAFANPSDALGAASGIVAARIIPAALEFVDGHLLGLIHEATPGVFLEGAGSLLLIEVDGDPAEVAGQVARIEGVVSRHGALQVLIPADPAEAERLWNTRRAAYGTLARASRSITTIDVTVPRDSMVEMMEQVPRLAAKHGLDYYAVAHAGDGNLHPALPFDPSNAGQLRRLDAFRWELQMACIRLGGSITGEHGVGVEKLAAMKLQYGPGELDTMRRLRRAFDPQGRLNPGKAIPAAASAW